MPDYREFNPKERRYRSIRRSIRRFATLTVTVALILGVSAAITAVIEAPQKRAEALSIAQSKAEILALELAAQSQNSQGKASVGPVRQEAGAEILTPISGNLITMPQNGRVDMSYFNDALFIGDSLTHGFEYYPTGIKEAKYAAYIGVGPKQLISGTVKKEDGTSVVAMKEIVQANASKIYILLGTNSLNSADTDEAIIKYYNNLLDTLAEKLPKTTVFYLQGMPPVTANKSAEKGFSNDRIRALNEQIAQMAFKRGYHYLDLNAALKDENGVLRADLAAGDGLHLNDVGYGVWKEYLITHTAYNKQSPYIMGSPFYLG
ncbi:MAG: GDSL-type esterase/lipase family protein [Oscillospiraceae bacterium]